MKEFWKKLTKKFLYWLFLFAIVVCFVIIFPDTRYSIVIRSAFSDMMSARTDWIRSQSLVGEWQCKGSNLTDFMTYDFTQTMNPNGTYSAIGRGSALDEDGSEYTFGFEDKGSYKKLDEKYIETSEEVTVTAFEVDGVDYFSDPESRSTIEYLERYAKGVTSSGMILSLDLHELILEFDTGEIMRCTRS